ncbi:HNH endonuclease [Calidifontibacter indicus]|uniref:HNH endonuclease signature motif containing protein n=1 Tax=Calidifontibacter indicus TaxID=419650 RepID=UPI003D728782
MYSADTVAAELGLGIQAGIGLVQRSARMVTRTPNLLREVAAGRANLDTAADIATELQDASPDVCETVEAEILRRGVHRATRGQARKSCRTLAGKHQPSAARETARKTRAQQCGVFQDPHPTPGLSMLTIIGDNGQITAVKDAIDQLAFAMKHGDESDKTLGEYRVDAFFDLAMRNVTLNLDIQVLTPTFGTAGKTWTKPANQAPTAAGPSSNDSGRADESGRTDDSNTGNDDDGRAADGGRDDESDEGDAGGGPPSGPGPDTGPPSTAPAELASEPETPAAFGGRNRDGRDFVSDMRERGATSVHARAGAIDADSLTDLARFADKVTVSSFEFDPVTGEPTANTLASESYRPPPTMARYVRTRDQRCRAPSCDRPAIKNVDLDHAVEWPQGPTATVNLECLCRRHHRMKQTQWRIRLHPNGIVEWTSPTGHTYRTTPGLTETWHDLTDP